VTRRPEVRLLGGECYDMLAVRLSLAVGKFEMERISKEVAII
jgi:hypothetical protein